uniref:Peptidase A1 domain-containing protein n=1 Tax=Leersia perrieri TaxID=77586 RepID=A0A0D9W8W2_9ORYZ
MFSHHLLVTILLSIAALSLTLQLIPSDAAVVHEQIAAAPSSNEDSINGGGKLQIAKEEIQLATSSSSHDNDQTAIAAGEEKLTVPLYGRPQSSTYLVQLRIGTPTDQISTRYVLFDTGSDLSWTQCQPCTNCSYSPYPPHDPSKSRTFRRLSCFDPMCELCTVSKGCLFRRLYGDGSTVSGDLVSDVFHFSVTGDDNYQFERDVAFGCANIEDCKAVRGYSSGILALGFGKTSFVTQLGVDRFSYCIPASEITEDGDVYDDERRSASFLRFGSHAKISGKRAPFTQDDSGYTVRLKRLVYQHGSRLNQQQPVPIFVGEKAASAMPMLVDSGTTLLWLPGSIFYPLQKKIEEDISLTRRYYFTHPDLYCYVGNMSDVEEVSVTLSFDGGVDLELFGSSLFFVDEDPREDWVCLAAAAGKRAILGVYPQRNINVGYDLSSMELSFDRDDCM